MPGQFAEWFDGGSLTNRGMYLSPWTSAKYLWAVAETVCGLDGYRTSGRPHIAPLLPAEWTWTAAVRVHWGGRRHTYVIDAERQTIVGDMDFASADEPYQVYFAGRDVSDEVRTSPVEVAAVAFEDAHGAVLIYVCNDRERPREVTLEFRGGDLPPARRGRAACSRFDRRARPGRRDADPRRPRGRGPGRLEPGAPCRHPPSRAVRAPGRGARSSW